MGEVSLTSTFSTHTWLAHQQESCEQETTAEGIPTKSQPLQSSGLSVTARAALHTPFPVCVWRTCSPSHCGEISPRESTDSLQTRPRLKEFLVHNSRQNRVGKQLNPNAEKQWFNRRGSPRQCPAQHNPAQTSSGPVRHRTLWQCPFRTGGSPKFSTVSLFVLETWT